MKGFCLFFIFWVLFGMCGSKGIEFPNNISQQNIKTTLDTIPPNSSDNNHIFISRIHPLPYFQGCEHLDSYGERKECSDEKIFAFIKKHLKYPEKAKKDKTEGFVVIQFTVESDGNISFNQDDSKVILKGIGNGCEEEAIRVLKLMPKWIPAKRKGKTIPVPFTIPIKFELDKFVDTIPPFPVLPPHGCSGETVPLFVKSMPRFSGCEDVENIDERKKCSDEKIINFVQNNLKYPIGQCVQGTAVIRFIVEKDGSLSHFEVLRNPWNSAGEEAIRVLKLMPKWIPGKQDGELARISFTLPIRFRL